MALLKNDLRYLVSTKIHIDSYESKMGKDDDIITFSFKLPYRDPCLDLVNFIEKGYDWVLDSDVSSGSMEDGGWLVFVETPRRPSFPSRLLELLGDMKSLTDNDPTTYEFVYKDEYGKKYRPVKRETLETIPLTPREYKKRNRDPELVNMLAKAGIDTVPENKQYEPDIDDLRKLAGR